MSQTFERYEKKYLLDENQYHQVLDKIQSYVMHDAYYKSQIRSIYYDTDIYELIRRSIEKPEYKEKLRIRSYGDTSDGEVFVEFKKKFDGIVYKRRTKANCKQVIDDIYHCDFNDAQIGKEIKYALNHYHNLHPCIYIGCDRTSYIGKQDNNLRITFDRHISYRTKNLSLQSSVNDKEVTDKTVMELKVDKAIPLWLCKILDETKVYPHSFSKVGNALIKEMKEVSA